MVLDTEQTPLGRWKPVAPTNHLHPLSMTTMTVDTHDNGCGCNCRCGWRQPLSTPTMCRVRRWCWTWNRRHSDNRNRLRPLTTSTHTVSMTTMTVDTHDNGCQQRQHQRRLQLQLSMWTSTTTTAAKSYAHWARKHTCFHAQCVSCTLQCRLSTKTHPHWCVFRAPPKYTKHVWTCFLCLAMFFYTLLSSSTFNPHQTWSKLPYFIVK